MIKITPLRVIGLAAILLVMLIGVTILTSGKKNLVLSILPKDALVQLDGKQKSGTSFTVGSGLHTIVIRKAGYLDQSHSVTVTDGQTTSLAIDLKPRTADNLVQLTVTSTLFKKYPNFDLQVLSSTSLDSGEWIVAQLQSNTDTSTVVLKRDTGSTGYAIYLGPGTSFDPTVVQRLPKDVQSAMKGAN